MKEFVGKDHLFAGIFLAGWLAFSLANLAAGGRHWADLGADLKKVDSVPALEEWIAGVESDIDQELLGREALIDLYGYLQKLLGKREFNHFSFVKDDDGMLYYGSTWPSGTEDLKEYASRVERLKQYVESRGARLLVVLPPSKILAGVSDVPRSWPLNDPNLRMDKLLTLLHQKGVDALDLRPALAESGRSLEELFFRTDHHWTPLAGFYAAREIVEQVRQRFGEDWDPAGFYTDLDNYHFCTYPGIMLGSSGRNTGAIYSGTEDYTLLWPAFPTRFTWTDYERQKVRSGPFTQSLMDPVELEISDLYGGSANRVYLDEISDHDRIVNHQNPSGPRLKVLRDSYFSATACFLAPMCSEIEMMWTRAPEGDAEAFVREGGYDYLILEIYPYNYDEISFSFFQEPEE